MNRQVRIKQSASKTLLFKILFIIKYYYHSLHINGLEINKILKYIIRSIYVKKNKNVHMYNQKHKQGN